MEHVHAKSVLETISSPEVRGRFFPNVTVWTRCLDLEGVAAGQQQGLLRVMGRLSAEIELYLPQD